MNTDGFSPVLLRAVRWGKQDSYYFNNDLLRPSDIFLASFPRSGNHFVRFIIYSALHYREHHTFPNNYSGMTAIPDIHNQDVHLAKGTPRILKTHFPFDPRYKHIIHLARDPGDVIVSYYYYARKLPTLFFTSTRTPVKLTKFISSFLHGNIWPCSFRDHWQSFTEKRTKVNYILISYDRLLTQPHEEFDRLLRFLRIELPMETLEQLITHTAFDNMVRLHQPPSAREGHVFEDRRYMLRKGVAGGYKNALSPAACKRIEREYGDIIEQIR